MAKKTGSTSSPAAGRVGLRYIGTGDYFPGIPRRDLTEKDLVRYAAAIAEVEAAGTLATLYESLTSAASASSATDSSATAPNGHPATTEVEAEEEEASNG